MCGLWKSLLYWSYFVFLQTLQFLRLYSVQSSLKIFPLVSSNHMAQMPRRRTMVKERENSIRQVRRQCGATAKIHSCQYILHSCLEMVSLPFLRKQTVISIITTKFIMKNDRIHNFQDVTISKKSVNIVRQKIGIFKNRCVNVIANSIHFPFSSTSQVLFRAPSSPTYLVRCDSVRTRRGEPHDPK